MSTSGIAPNVAAALINFVGVLLALGVREGIALIVRRRQRARDLVIEQDSRRETARRYADPLRQAAESLASRLDEVIARARYFAADAPSTQFFQYKRVSTIYRVAVLLGWIRAFRREQSYLDPQMTQTPDAIRAIESALADGQIVERQRLGALVALWACPQDSSTPEFEALAAAVDEVRHRCLDGATVSSASELNDDDQHNLVSRCAQLVRDRMNVEIPKITVAETINTAVDVLATTEAYIYRDWQAAVGDLMIREVSNAARRFDVLGYGEFEELYQDVGNRHAQLWIGRLKSLFLSIDFTAADVFDARQEQLRNLQRECETLSEHLRSQYQQAEP